jgi:hypothetical protein
MKYSLIYRGTRMTLRPLATIGETGDEKAPLPGFNCSTMVRLSRCTSCIASGADDLLIERVARPTGASSRAASPRCRAQYPAAALCCRRSPWRTRGAAGAAGLSARRRPSRTAPASPPGARSASSWPRKSPRCDNRAITDVVLLAACPDRRAALSSPDASGRLTPRWPAPAGQSCVGCLQKKGDAALNASCTYNGCGGGRD